MAPKISAENASSTPSRLASRSGATENEVSPSIERPSSEPQPNVVCAVDALRRLVVDALLPKADPARQSLEEAIALRQAAHRIRGARREQAEIAGVLGDLVARAPVEQRVECLAAEAAQRGLVLAMRLGGVDDVVAVVLPVAHQRLDQRRRMLAVAVHEQHGAVPRVIEPGGKRRLLAEIARQRDDLHVERGGRERARDAQRVVRAAVVDVDDLDDKPARREALRHLGELRMQAGEAARLVVERNDNRQTGIHQQAYSRTDY